MYQPLNTVDSTHGSAEVMAAQNNLENASLTTSDPLVVGMTDGMVQLEEGPRALNLKLLFREKKFDIVDVSSESTVAELKERISTICEVPVKLQRLIFNGRPMKPDDKRLRALNIVDNSYIHLFPVPESNLADTERVAQVSNTPTNEGATPNIVSILLPLSLLQTGPQVPSPVHNDFRVINFAKDLRISCLLLFFMYVFDTLRYIGSLMDGSASEKGALDVCVNVFGAFLAPLACYVCFVGVHLSERLDARFLRKYNSFLPTIAIGCSLQAVMLVVDVVMQVLGLIGHAHDASSSSSADNDQSEPEMDDMYIRDRLLPFVFFNAFLSAMIVIAMWGFAVIRSRQLLEAIENFLDRQVERRNSNTSFANA